MSDQLVSQEIAIKHVNLAEAKAHFGLRAGDAWRIAIAAQQGATICTLDKRLAEAATALGIRADLV